MIKVNDISERTDLNVLLKVTEGVGSSSKWVLRDLEYSGAKYEGMFPSEIEQLSKSGFELSPDRFRDFVKSVADSSGQRNGWRLLQVFSPSSTLQTELGCEQGVIFGRS